MRSRIKGYATTHNGDAAKTKTMTAKKEVAEERGTLTRARNKGRR